MSTYNHYGLPAWSERVINDLGRASVTSTDPGTDDTYYDKQTYDGYGRVYQVFDATRTSASWTDNVVAVQYNATGVGSYRYGAGSAGPHAVTQAGSHTYTYDANGNMTQERHAGSTTRTLSYTAFNQVRSITRGTHTTRFVYDPQQSRVRRTDVVRTGSGASSTTTLYLGGAEKVIAPDGSYTYKRYVSPGVLIEQTHDSSGSRTSEALRYLLYDHLGSLDVVADAAGTVVQDLSFDAWGQRRAPNDWTTPALLRLADTTHGRYTPRGFTGHEMLDAVGIIHTNGRIYDPKLARFLVVLQ